ncbi:hypothetical protein RUM43_010054, partial [Polyplax serrata]
MPKIVSFQSVAKKFSSSRCFGPPWVFHALLLPHLPFPLLPDLLLLSSLYKSKTKEK